MAMTNTTLPSSPSNSTSGTFSDESTSGGISSSVAMNENTRVVSHGQIGLNQRVNELRKSPTRSGVWLPSNFSAIVARSVDEILRECRSVRAQLLQQASSSISSSSSATTNNINVNVNNEGDDDDGRRQMEMLQAQLLLASATPPRPDLKVYEYEVGDASSQRCRQFVFTTTPIDEQNFTDHLNNIYRNFDQHFPLHHHHNINNAYPNFSVGSQQLAPSNSHSQDPLPQNNDPVAAPPPADHNNINNTNISDGDDKKEEGDGQIHSVPYRKNGPYTCSKCHREFPTSQHFAAHVGATHYRFETKEQRRRRMMAKPKIRKRTLRLQKVDDGLTFVPVSHSSSSDAATGMNNNTTSSWRPIASHVKAEEVAPPQANNAFTTGSVNIKLEPDG